MGNKSNPTGLRVGINKKHKSSWFASKNNFALMLSQDIKARKLLQTKFASSGIASIELSRDSKKIDITLTVAKPGVVIGRGGKSIEDAKKELIKIFKANVDMKIVESKSPESDAAIIAYMVGDQCLRRVPPKQAMQRELEKLKNINGVLGAKIAISGRIKGAEIARTEKVSWGSVPLQTLRADIDYHLHVVRVPSAGLHGIKVWVYKGEKLN